MPVTAPGDGHAPTYPRGWRVFHQQAELWAAADTVEKHASGQRCAWCRQGDPDRCRLRQEADDLLRQWEAERGRPYRSGSTVWRVSDSGRAR